MINQALPVPKLYCSHYLCDVTIKTDSAYHIYRGYLTKLNLRSQWPRSAQALMVFLDNDKCQPQCAYGGDMELLVI